MQIDLTDHEAHILKILVDTYLWKDIPCLLMTRKMINSAKSVQQKIIKKAREQS